MLEMPLLESSPSLLLEFTKTNRHLQFIPDLTCIMKWALEKEKWALPNNATRVNFRLCSGCVEGYKASNKDLSSRKVNSPILPQPSETLGWAVSYKTVEIPSSCHMGTVLYSFVPVVAKISEVSSEQNMAWKRVEPLPPLGKDSGSSWIYPPADSSEFQSSAAFDGARYFQDVGSEGWIIQIASSICWRHCFK